MIARIDWKPAQDSQTWIADFGAVRLCVRSVAPSSRGEFVGYIEGQSVGFWDSAEVAKTNVAALASLPPSNITRWTPRRKKEIVDAVRSGLITADGACRRYNLTDEEFASWRRLFEKHGVAGLRVSHPRH